ncbi:Maf family protein [Alteromonas flava]|uniref:Maf family protein n=1 Tax=Alteromonas flava TaxID=2048003 RepID=UPI000C281356|nr:nucleoside triphosphate pyrophosphatase [Alteromonas flava]
MHTYPPNNRELRLILASTSRYRASLLKRLGLNFECIAPKTDESPFENETPKALAERLAIAKASAVAQQHNGLVIGSDQVAAVVSDDDKPLLLGKPGTRDNAIAQLTLCNDRTVTFYTAVALVDSQHLRVSSHIEIVNVDFRRLNAQQIAAYVDKEQPFDCAGSFKSEGLGVRLFKRIQSNDPNCIIGLPMIGLVDLLLERGIDPLYSA